MIFTCSKVFNYLNHHYKFGDFIYYRIITLKGLFSRGMNNYSALNNFISFLVKKSFSFNKAFYSIVKIIRIYRSKNYKKQFDKPKNNNTNFIIANRCFFLELLSFVNWYKNYKTNNFLNNNSNKLYWIIQIWIFLDKTNYWAL